MISPRWALYLVAAALVAVGFFGYGHHQKQQGRAEVQAKFDAYVAEKNAATLQASLDNQEVSLLKQRAVDRSRQHDYENTKRLESANARLGGTVAGLRNTIATLNRPAKAGDAAATGTGTDGAAEIARELLGECAIRYSNLAEEAGNLAAQVIGLQGFVLAIEKESDHESIQQ